MSSMDKQNLIFPLSYDPDLKEKEEQEIYYRYLNAAFEEPRIKNIGVVGSYGVGKSSLLHSYEKREHKHFLYVTMGKSKDNNDDSKNAIERRILLQIYSKFRREDIPLSGFEMIREAMSHVKSKVAVGIMASGDIIVDLLCTTGQITEGETALKLSADPAENIHPYRSVHYNDRMVIADIRLSVL